LVGEIDFEFVERKEIDIRFKRQPCCNYFKRQVSFSPRPFAKLFFMGYKI
jgi:hypothetical protein